MIAFTMEQAEQTTRYMTMWLDEAGAKVPAAKQGEWMTEKGRYIEAVYDSVERMMIAESAYQMVMLEEQNTQLAAIEQLKAWKAKHGCDWKHIVSPLSRSSQDQLCGGLRDSHRHNLKVANLIESDEHPAGSGRLCPLMSSANVRCYPARLQSPVPLLCKAVSARLCFALVPDDTHPVALAGNHSDARANQCPSLQR